jgi:arylsulfatase A-like enzyme
LTDAMTRGTVARSFNPVRISSVACPWMGLIVALAAACSQPPLPPVAGAPYVVLVTIDTLRADATSPYGAPPDATPHLAAVARRSVQFDRAFASMPTTGPSHLSMLTGLYPQQLGALQNGVAARPGVANLAALLRQSGRRTAAFVSVHHLSRETLGLDGFEVWDAPEEVRDGKDTVAAAEAWLDRVDGAPFFLWVHLFDPHQPYKAHDGAPAEVVRALARLGDVEVPNRGGFAAGSVTAVQREKLELLYRADVHYADRQLGRLLDALEARDLAARAAVAITSDHGEVLGEALADFHYGFDHGEFLLPMEVRVPLWVRLPDGAQGTRESRTVETRALFGTLADAAGMPVAGAAVLPGLTREGGAGRDADAFVVRRSFLGRDLPPVLHGTRHGVATGGTLLVRSQRDDTRQIETWRCGDEYPTGLSAVLLPPSEVRGREAQLEAWLAGLGGAATAPGKGPDGATRERLRALGYLD